MQVHSHFYRIMLIWPCAVILRFWLSVMLQWFVAADRVSEALKGGMLTVSDVKSDVKRVSSACQDENLEIGRIQQHFNKQVWARVLKTIEMVKSVGWLSTVCRQELDGEQIGCDSCPEWHHFACAGLHKSPKAKTWYYRKCHRN